MYRPTSSWDTYKCLGISIVNSRIYASLITFSVELLVLYFYREANEHATQLYKAKYVFFSFFAFSKYVLTYSIYSFHGYRIITIGYVIFTLPWTLTLIIPGMVVYIWIEIGMRREGERERREEKIREEIEEKKEPKIWKVDWWRENTTYYLVGLVALALALFFLLKKAAKYIFWCWSKWVGPEQKEKPAWVFAGTILFISFQICSVYAVLFYNHNKYMEVPQLEFDARSTLAYFGIQNIVDVIFQFTKVIF